LLDKGWFSDSSLKNESKVWPNRFLNGFRVPFWVDRSDAKVWVEMDEPIELPTIIYRSTGA
jgi:hypothetical protein